MNFFKIKTTWSNAEFIPFKLCVASFYIVVGAYFNEIVSQYYVPLLVLFAITMVVTVVLWGTKMAKNVKE